VGAIEIVLENNGSGYGVNLTATTQALQVATLCADDLFGAKRRKAFIPQLDGYAYHAFSHPSKIPSSAGLAPLRSVGIERQADHHLDHAFTLHDRGQGIEEGRQALAAVENGEWRRKHTQLVAQSHANPSLSSVDAEHSTPPHV
jgi:hypothetical protein